MSTAIVSWEEVTEATKAGGKGRALARLRAQGFDVPAGLVVPPDAGTERLPERLASEFPVGTLFAVRSSASDEDGVENSFAGQLESFLSVPADAVPAFIEKVRESATGDRVVAYRANRGLSMPPPVPAVIVQQMVPADFAGVAFSSDPVSGRHDLAVVAAVRGLGESLVSGAEEGETHTVDRHGKVETKSESALHKRDIARVANLARQCAAFFGCPQDIEWAMADGRLHLLQSRPITSLAGMTDPGGVCQVWDTSNIAESYAGVTTPLTFSFASHVYEEVYRQFVKILRVPAASVERENETFAHMLGMVRGRIYYNLISWYRVLALLPGFQMNRGFMEQMMGVKEPLPESVVEEIIRANAKSRIQDAFDLAGTLAGLIINQVLLERKKRAFELRLQSVLGSGGLAFSDLRADELTAEYRRLERELLTRWDAPLINDFFAMIHYGLLRKLADKWCDDSNGSLQNDLIAGQGGIISAEPARRVIEMARLASSHPTLIQALKSGSRNEIRQESARVPDFALALEAYLGKFGDRCLEELKLETATLRDDPSALHRSIGGLAGQPPREIVPTNWKEEAEARAARALKGHPIRKWIFDFILGQARGRVRDRENLRFERTRVFGRVRAIFVELGKRFYASRLLDEPRDVFYLTIGEILGYVEGTAVTTRLGELAAMRKSEFAGWRNSEAPPDRFMTKGMVPVGIVAGDDAAPEEPGTGDLQGLGCCPGKVTGSVRVILDPREAVIIPGEILVAPRTDPGWILLFPPAAGLLVEQGSLLSHSAIVAREMSLPAIVSVKDLTRRLKTGDVVEMNGATGTIKILSSLE